MFAVHAVRVAADHEGKGGSIGTIVVSVVRPVFADVDHRVAVVQDAGNKLRRWHRVTVSDVNAGFPAELMGGASIGGREWPTDPS